MFLATSIAMQQEVKVERSTQNILIQKISNLLETGEDKISYKKAVEKLNRMQLEKIGTERSREKPINIIQKNIEINNTKINELKKYENIQYEIEEEKNDLKNDLKNKEIKNELLKEIKIKNEKNNLENEKIKIKESIIEENKNKINLINNNLEKINEKILNEKNNSKNINGKYEKNKLNKKLNLFLIIIILINVLWILFIPKITENKIIKYIFLLTVPTFLIFYIFSKNNLKNKIKIIENNQKNNLEKINNEKINIENNKKIYEENLQQLLNEINKLKTENNFFNNLEENKLINKYEKNINKNEINYLLKKENIEPQLENLSSLEEELYSLRDQYEELKRNNMSIELVKTLLSRAYENMKNSISPVFTEKLSKNIETITRGKYCKLTFNDEQGLIVELDNGNYIPAERLSIGTIDQLYLSLRLAMLDEISNEKVPIILDESFAYYDDDRLKNILMFLVNEFKDRQIIILTCTKREKDILEQENIDYNFVEM